MDNPIPCGYALLIEVWALCPTDWLSASQVEAKGGRLAYMHVGSMVRLGLLEESLMLYRPTAVGWMALHDYECFHESFYQSIFNESKAEGLV